MGALTVGVGYWGLNLLLRGGVFPSLEKKAEELTPGLVNHLESVNSKIDMSSFSPFLHMLLWHAFFLPLFFSAFLPLFIVFLLFEPFYPR